MKMINENNILKDYEFSNFAYYFVTKLYGMKQIVDQKFIIFLLSIKKYITILRVNIFARFLCLLDNKTENFTLVESNKYIEVLNYVHYISTVGHAPSLYENDVHYTVPYIRIMAYITNFGDNRMSEEENNLFKKEIEVFRKNDPRNEHTSGIIDFDEVLNIMLIKYR